MALRISPPRRRGTTRLPDGRRLGWSEWGDENGAPVLVCPGAATSSLLGLAQLEREDVRVIALDRPGLGASAPHPTRTLLDWANDLRAFLVARDLGAPSIVGISQGAPFALACAAAGLVRGVAVVSGTDELAMQAELLVPDVRAIVERARRDPEGAEAYFRGMDAAMFAGMVTQMSSPADRAIYAEPAFDALFRAAVDEAFAQGPGGYARDTLLAFSAWPLDLSQIRVPVWLWYGEDDASPVHSPDRGESLARRIPGARRTVLEGGGAIAWTRSDEIVAALLREK